jgi:dienelactone hydrolase
MRENTMTTLRSICYWASLLALCLGSAAGCSSGESAAGDPAQAAEAAQTSGAESPAEPAPIEGKEVTYEADGTQLKGFIAYPANALGKRPGVLVVHEWWGHNDYTRMRAQKLAELGYVALAVDMYGDGKQVSHPEDAGKMVQELMGNLPVATKRFEAARALLAADPRTDPDRIAAIGYCLGGAVVLHMARSGADLDAIAVFHGMLSTQKPMSAGAFRGKVLVATGGADPMVPAEQVQAFEKEMQAAQVPSEVASYPNAKHAFTNPSATENGEKFKLPLAYDAQADADSWQKLQELLASVWPAS